MKVKEFIEENKKYLFVNLSLILIAILYYILRVKNSLIYFIGELTWFFVGLGIFLILVASIFYLREKYFQRSIIACTTLIILCLFMFARVGENISVGTLRILNYNAIELFKKHANSIPTHDYEMTDSWIIDSDEWHLTEKEKKKLTKYFKGNSGHLLYGDGYCFFILGGFLDNSHGFAYKISDSEEKPEFFGLKVSYIRKVNDNWIYFATN